MLRPAPRLALCLWHLVAIAAAAVGSTKSELPLALRQVNPGRLSGGLFAALDAEGLYGGVRLPHSVRAGVTDLSKGRPPVVLDARVGANIRVGDDPAALPLAQAGQAEPHLARSVANPAVLLATFQEGRFSDAGALDCGYGISRDGGLTWTRALIPLLTQSSGGAYNRATDPVAAVGPQGDLYLNTLASVSGAFNTGAVVVSRSTDGGATWTAPSVVFLQSTAQSSPDKNWIAVNDFPGTPNSGRLVVTWTNFTSNSGGTSTGSNIVASLSDDRGGTWSTPIAVTPAGTFNQGSQPVYLPDGSLAVVYATFPDGNTTDQFAVSCRRSTDGGRTYLGEATIAPFVNAWNDPNLRTGVFLPAVAVARNTGGLFAAYIGLVGTTPRVFVAKSTDEGASWSTPVAVSDNPGGVSVMNPALTVTPDGQSVSVVFLDKRNAPDQHNYIDVYAAESFDGGSTWQPNLRLTDMTTDIRFTTATTRGYMVGDYQGVAPALAADEPCVAIWCDGRSGDADPFTVRFTPSATANYDAWRIARGVGKGSDDDDDDGWPNVLEYALATNPRVAEAGEALVYHRLDNGELDVSVAQRTDFAGQLTIEAVATTTNGSAGQTPVPTPTPQPNPDPPIVAPTPGSLSGHALTGVSITPGGTTPDTPLPPGMTWATFHVVSTAQIDALRFRPAVSGYVDSLDNRTPGLSVVPDEASVVGTSSRLVNVSTRGVVGTNNSQMIVGFVTDGQKTILIRAAGPALTAIGVSGAIAQPELSLAGNPPNTAISVTNAGWQQGNASSAVFSRVGAFPFPDGSADAALLQTLPGGAYTAIVSGANGGTGLALAEAYDADATPGAPTGPRIVNLSTRAAIAAGDASTVIAGFVVVGGEPRRVLIRAVGPTLGGIGIAGALSDPTLTVYQMINGTNVSVATVDDWGLARSSAAITATGNLVGAFPLATGSLDSALLVTLPPGNYSAVVSGVSGAAGIVLVEVYDAG